MWCVHHLGHLIDVCTLVKILEDEGALALSPSLHKPTAMSLSLLIREGAVLLEIDALVLCC